MQTVAEVMSRNAQVVAPWDSLQRAAQLMDELDVGALPVCDGEQLVGMVTDRDLAVRGIAAGKSPQDAHIDEVMSAQVRWCFEDQPLDEVITQMADSQIRRIPVVSHDDQRRLVGIVSLGDVATRAGGQAQHDSEDALEAISMPPGGANPGKVPDDPQTRTGQVSAGSSSTGIADPGGKRMPDGGGESSMGVAGASGQPRAHEGGDAGRSGATADPRGNYGVSGQDITADRIPPASPNTPV